MSDIEAFRAEQQRLQPMVAIAGFAWPRSRTAWPSHFSARCAPRIASPGSARRPPRARRPPTTVFTSQHRKVNRTDDTGQLAADQARVTSTRFDRRGDTARTPSISLARVAAGGPARQRAVIGAHARYVIESLNPSAHMKNRGCAVVLDATAGDVRVCPPARSRSPRLPIPRLQHHRFIVHPT